MSISEYKKRKLEKWSKEKTLLLIEKFHKLPELWNASSKYYRNREKKAKALMELADSFNVDQAEISRKLHNLRCQLNGEIRKTQKKRNGQVFKSTWEYFEALQFMVGQLTFRDGIGNTELSKQEEVLSEDTKEEPTPETIQLTEHLMEELVGSFPSTAETSITDNSKPKQKKAHKDLQEEAALKRAFALLEKSADDHQVFGDFVAAELRNMRSEEKRKKLKRMIQWDILQITEEDDSESNSNSVSHITSTHSW